MSARRLTRAVPPLALLLALAGSASALDVAVPYVGADYIWGQGHTGSNVEIGVIDLYLADQAHLAIDGNHAGSVKFSTGAQSIGSHATQVTGAAASQDSTYTGVAPNAQWWSGQSANPGLISSQVIQTVAAETFANGLDSLGGNPVEVITLSIGLSGNTSGADHWSLGLDHIVNTNGTTITVAAGNAGPNPGTLSGLPTGAYNVILVGATGDTGGIPSQDYSRVASYSSRGPTSDGRSKPDIVSPGSVIHLPTLYGAWSNGDGTSFATPLVAGGAALLIDAGTSLGYSTDAKVIKSVLLNSADKLAGWSASSTAPLDRNQGAGQMDLQNAYLQYAPGQRDPGAVPAVGWDREELTWNTENLYAVDGRIPAGEIITITLVWDRIVTASEPPKLKDTVYTFDHLDNLDLYLYDADDLSTPLASSVSTVDNVEHIYHTAAQAGRYVIGVKMAGASADDLETYALAWDVPAVPLLPGDANLDGIVDIQDFFILKANFDNDPAAWREGNFNDDTIVDIEDFFILKDHFDEHTPEPATLGLLAFGAFSLLLRKRPK